MIDERKKVLIYLLRKISGLTNREIGKAVRMKNTAVSMAGISLECEMKKDKGIRKEI